MSQFLLCKAQCDLSQYGGVSLMQQQENKELYQAVLTKYHPGVSGATVLAIEQIHALCDEAIEKECFETSKLYSVLNELYEKCDWMLLWYGNEYEDVETFCTKEAFMDYVKESVNNPGGELYASVIVKRREGEYNREFLCNNGYIIQRDHESVYQGIDGDNWYLNYCSDNSYFEEFYDAQIEKSWANPAALDCCTDMEYINRYKEESAKLGIPFRVLLCSTSKPEPVLEGNCVNNSGRVLGYDVAYPGGSYYSCVLNDIVSGRIAEFGEILLNENGLFSTYEEAEDFLEYRAKLEKETAKYRFEKGDYVIYKLTEVEI